MGRETNQTWRDVFAKSLSARYPDAESLTKRIRSDVLARGEALTQSPVERALFNALVIVGIDRFGTVALRGRGEVQLIAFASGERNLIIAPQWRLLDYEIDFMVIGGERALAAVDGVTKPYVAVECDGHEFHEKTKEQASADKRRDREIQKQRVPVFRFSGADIWRDVFECAIEIVSEIESELDRRAVVGEE